MENTQDTPSGKTCRARFQAIRDGTSSKFCEHSSARRAETTLMCLSLHGQAGQTSLFGETPDVSWETVTRLPGACWTPNTGACPKDAKESSLSAILQADAPEKYSLSARACLGILKRAEKRGKKIPALLWEALVETVEHSTCSKTPSADR